MSDLTNAELAALERAEKAATPGPWEHRYLLGDPGWPCLVAYGIGGVFDAPKEYVERDENVILVSLLRNAAPSLLAEIRRLRAIIAKTHEDYCVPYKLGEGERRHSTECLLFELTGEPQP